MIDRKTKDIDASVELLEDRKKTCKIIGWLLFGMYLVLGGGYAYFFWLFISKIVEYKDESTLFFNAWLTGLIPVFIILATFVLLVVVIAFRFDAIIDRYTILIYLKRQFEKRRNNK